MVADSKRKAVSAKAFPVEPFIALVQEKLGLVPDCSLKREPGPKRCEVSRPRAE